MFKITFLDKTFPTLPTFVCSFPVVFAPVCMGEDVPGNGSLAGAHFATVVTSVGPHTWGRLLLLVPAAGRPHALHCNTTCGSTPVVGGVGQSCRNPRGGRGSVADSWRGSLPDSCPQHLQQGVAITTQNTGSPHLNTRAAQGSITARHRKEVLVTVMHDPLMHGSRSECKLRCPLRV